MIDDLEVRLTEELAQRQRRVARWLLVATLINLYYGLVELSMRAAAGVLPEGLRFAVLMVDRNVLAINIGMHIALVFLLGGLIRQVKLPVFSEIMSSTLSLIPVLQLCAGWTVCLRLGQSWREHRIEASYRGPTVSGLEALRVGVRCGACGYDVRGVVTGTCAECGSKIARLLEAGGELMEKIKVFWLEFIVLQDALRRAQSADEAVYERLLERLHQIDNRLYVEFATGDMPELIITAQGNRECFSLVDRVVAAAPDDTDWKIFELKPRLGFPEVAEYEGYEVRPADVRFVPLRREGSSDLGLRVYLPNWREAAAERAWLAIMNACDHGLGERMFAERVQHVEVGPFDRDIEQRDLIPLVDLDAFLGLR